MKDHYDTTRTKAGERKFPKFKAGQAVAVSVPVIVAVERELHRLPGRVWASEMSVTPGRMMRVLRVHGLHCLCLDLRSLRAVRVEKAELSKW